MPKIPKINLWAGVVLCWALVMAATVLSEAKLPSTDVFLFKEAGINFGSHGKLTAKNLPHMPQDHEFVFSYYPPVYPFCFGVWTHLVGIGLKQSLAFDALIRMLRTLLIGLFFLPWFRANRRKMIFAVSCLFILSFLSSDGDRPDELAMVWGWAAWLVAQETTSWLGIGVSGVLLGLCGATSPAAGVFFVLGATAIYIANRFRPLWRPALSVVVAGITFGLCNLPIYLSDPLAYARFSKQVPLSTFPYLIAWKEGKGFSGVVTSFITEMKHPVAVAGPYLFLVVTLGGYLLSYLIRRRREIPRLAIAIFCSSFLYLFLSIFIWTLQPNYLWFSGVAFVGILSGSFFQRGRFSEGLTVAVFVVALSPLLVREFKLYSTAWERRESDQWQTVRNEVLPLVGMNAKFAVTADQYFTFRADRQIDNVIYVCDRLNEYDFVYITRYNSASLADPDPFRIPCDGNTACFTVMHDFSDPHRYQLAGIPTSFVVKGSAGVLYHNTACPHPNALSLNP